MKKELAEIGKAIDDKSDVPWWILDEYIGLLRQCHTKLLKMKPVKSCQYCRHFDLTKCGLVNKIPPDSIKAKGCEKFEDTLNVLMG